MPAATEVTALPRLVLAAATVALLALAQALAVGAVSATPLGADRIVHGVVAGLMAATLGALVVTVLSRSPAEIAAPAAQLAVIYAALGADLVAAGYSGGEVWAALSLAVAMAGILIGMAGWLRIAEAVRFMPAPVNAGFVTGIGLLVIWSQLGPVLGLEGRLARYEWSEVLALMKPGSLIVAGVTIVTAWLAMRAVARAQPALLALAAGTAAHHLIEATGGGDLLGPKLGVIDTLATAVTVTTSVWSVLSIPWFLSAAAFTAPYAVFLALQATVNTAVTAANVAVAVGERPDPARTLKAQGCANVVCGCLGALPVTSLSTLSLAAARTGVMTPLLPAASAVILLVAAVAAGGALQIIPVAALAGLLIVAGMAMLDRWSFALARSLWRREGDRAQLAGNLLLVAAVASAFLFGGVPVALVIGALLATVLLAVNLSRATTIEHPDGTRFASSRAWPVEQAQWLVDARARITVLRPRGGLFFGTADQLAARLDAVGSAAGYCLIDLSRLTTLDATGCQTIAVSAKKLAGRGVVTVLAGLTDASARGRELASLGLTHPPAATHWFADLDHALEWIETQLVHSHWPALDLEAPVELGAVPLTRGLREEDLETLRGHLARIVLEEGPLFRHGDPGASLFIVHQGRVEIRVESDGSRDAVRLATFGPGSVFGEVAMLTSGRRTADAICVRPSVLYELRRDAFERLGNNAPELYTRILSNLNAHLAARLVITTELVRTA